MTRLLLPLLLLAAPALAATEPGFTQREGPLYPAAASQRPPSAQERPTEQIISSLPVIKPSTIWVKVKSSITIEKLSSQLGLDETQLAKLNRVDEDHRFNAGDLLALPSSKAEQLDRIASLDPAGARLASPLQSSQPPTVGGGVVRFGDTLLLIAERYGLTLAELLRLNPGLETARLVVGSTVHITQSEPNIRSRMLRGMNRVDSGGLSWPVLPNFAHQQPMPEPPLRTSADERRSLSPRRFDASLDELVRDGVISPSEGVRVHGGLHGPTNAAWRQACSRVALSPQECGIGRLAGDSSRSTPAPTATHKPLSTAEQALLQKIRSAPSSTWRQYGSCNYDWGGWRLIANGVRTTATDCGGTAKRWTVGVHCEKLLVNTFHSDSGWQSWKKPAGPDSKFRAGEDEMVAALCANVSSAGQEVR
ncbi:MAG: LysM peptidoglycan-binding domain-containing protein [Cyanobacteria bacterium]|nr:LysM peptidoglycan-binding domain-containing protein [Cyanobacteriota bacterium]